MERATDMLHFIGKLYQIKLYRIHLVVRIKLDTNFSDGLLIIIRLRPMNEHHIYLSFFFLSLEYTKYRDNFPNSVAIAQLIFFIHLYKNVMIYAIFHEF